MLFISTNLPAELPSSIIDALDEKYNLKLAPRSNTDVFLHEEFQGHNSIEETKSLSVLRTQYDKYLLPFPKNFVM